MEVHQLKETLTDRIKGQSKEYWLKQLNSRKMAELTFHNKDRDKAIVRSLPQDTYELLHGNKKYYLTTQLSREYVNNWLRDNVKGKIFLDYACGNGKNAITAAELGASLAIGLDISDVSVNNAAEEAKGKGLQNAVFVQGDCENTELPNGSVDVIICSGMLHHLNLSYAFPELRRILKPGGKILAVEALNYNPIIKLYRMITPSMRTEWEKNHILSLKDLTFAQRFFNVENVKYWHICSYFAAFAHRRPALMSLLNSTFNALDKVLTKTPLIQLLAWQFTFELVKPLDD